MSFLEEEHQNEKKSTLSINDNWGIMSKILLLLLLVGLVFAKITDDWNLLVTMTVVSSIYCFLVFLKYFKPVKRIAVNETKELEEEYQKILNGLNEDTKRMIQKKKTGKIIGFGSIALLIVIVGYWMLNSSLHEEELLAFLMIFLAICFYFVLFLILISVALGKNNDSVRYKEEMIKPFVEKMIPGAHYDPTIKKDWDYLKIEYQKAFGSNSFHLISEDCVAGKMDETGSFEMSDIYFRSYSRNGQLAPFLNFRGCFCIIDIHKSFAPSKVMLSSMNPFDDKEIVRVEHEAFNEYFEIHAFHHEEVKKYMTQELMDYLVNFAEQYGISFEMAFEDKIYIRFYTGNMYEIRSFGGEVDKQTIYKFYCITKFIKDIHEIMKKSI